MSGERVLLGLADLRLAVEGDGAARVAAGAGAARTPEGAPADLVLRVRRVARLVAPQGGVRWRSGPERALHLAEDARGTRVAEVGPDGVRRVMHLDAARREAVVEIADVARAAGLGPLAPPFDDLLLATRLAREGALLLRAAAVVRGGMALAFTLRTRAMRDAASALLGPGRPGVLARRRLVVRPGADGPRAVDGALRDAACQPQAAPLGAVHLLHAATQLVAEPRCGGRAADALMACAVLPADLGGCVGVFASARALAAAVPVVRLGCPPGAGLRRFADGAGAPAAA